MNIALIGYGKMGHEIENVLIERGHRVSLIIDAENRNDICAEKLSDTDVAIEFTSPDTAYENITSLISLGIPVVSGSTGWLAKMADVEALTRSCGGAFFYASNYSIGVNVFFKINEMLTRIMNRYPQYDVTVEEVHHTQKKDFPSGTAITIAEGIVSGIDRKKEWCSSTTTVPEQLEVMSIRRSVVPGTHTVTWESSADMITLNHTAKGRRGFAEGAVLAAEFIKDKSGIFSMDNLMQF